MKKFACPYTGNTYDLDSFKGYEFISTLPNEQAQALLDIVLQQAYETNRLYNDDSSCLVANIDTDHHSNIMLKVPRERNNRAWERILTLFRPNEAFRTFASMMVVKSIGLNCPQPLIAAHKKENGMSVDSFFVYEFVEGAPGTKEDVSILLQAMKSLHQAGYTRSDPKVVNFIVSNDEAIFIDFRLKKPKIFTNFQCTLNLCRFLHLAVSRDRKELDCYFEGNRLLNLAHHFLMLNNKVRRLRRGVRGIFSKKGK